MPGTWVGRASAAVVESRSPNRPLLRATIVDPDDDIPIAPTAPARILREEIASLDARIMRLNGRAVHLSLVLDDLHSALAALTAPPDRQAMARHLRASFDDLDTAILTDEIPSPERGGPHPEADGAWTGCRLDGHRGGPGAGSRPGTDPARAGGPRARTRADGPPPVEPDHGAVRGGAVRGAPRLRHRPLRAGDQQCLSTP